MQPDTMPLGYPLSAHGATMWSREAPVAHVLLVYGDAVPIRDSAAPRLGDHDEPVRSSGAVLKSDAGRRRRATGKAARTTTAGIARLLGVA